MRVVDTVEFAFRLHDCLVEEIGKKFPVENQPALDNGDSAKQLYISFLNRIGPYSLALGFLKETISGEAGKSVLPLFEDNYTKKFPQDVELYARVKTGNLFTNSPPFNSIMVAQDGERLGGVIGKAFNCAAEIGQDFHADLAARNVVLVFDHILKELEDKVRASEKRKSGGFWSFLKS